jgi:hypothetical protein
MPALPAVPLTLKCTIGFSLPGDANAIVRTYETYTGTPPTPTQASAFAQSVGAAFGTRFAAYMAIGTSQTSVTVEDLNTNSGAVGFDVTAHAGTRNGGVLAPGTALMIQHIIARRYRGGKPKMFLPFGVSTDITAGGLWSSAIVTPAGTAIINFYADLAAAGWTGAGTITHTNVSYYQGFTVVTNPITHRSRNVPTLRGTPLIDTVINYSVEQGIASQRRRNNV